ncbi:hypothetical protein BC832DRAFT_544048 [Gaertneriomyces semiglobifer]|nr:hypothetical protein BC832DRAFT_544048 [Gaertneriomyces semiglobifer]
MSGEQATIWQKIKHKNQENPFLFPAFALTVLAFGRMTTSLFRRDVYGFQIGQRWRVAAQTLTIGLIGGTMWYEDYKKTQKAAAVKAALESNGSAGTQNAAEATALGASTGGAAKA